MGPVIYQTGDVVLGHLGELFLEYAFQAGQDDQAFALIVVVDNPELDFSLAFLDDRRLRNTKFSYNSNLTYRFRTFSGNGTTVIGLCSDSGEAVWEFLMRLMAATSSSGSMALRFASATFALEATQDRPLRKLYFLVLLAPSLRRVP